MISRRSLRNGSEGIISSGGTKGTAETTSVAAEYVTSHAEVVVTTLERNGNGKLHRGTGIEGENPKTEEEEVRLFSPSSSHTGQKVWTSTHLHVGTYHQFNCGKPRSNRQYYKSYPCRKYKGDEDRWVSFTGRNGCSLYPKHRDTDTVKEP